MEVVYHAGEKRDFTEKYNQKKIRRIWTSSVSVFSASYLFSRPAGVVPFNDRIDQSRGSVQLSIQCEKDAVRALLFPSPRILTEQTAGHFLGLVNEANQELYRGSALGRFWVDVKNLDLAYEFIFKEAMLESDPEEIATQLFDVPLAHFYDLHIPLVMQAGGIWDCNTALLYLQQLRKDGYVDNKDFGLW